MKLSIIILLLIAVQLNALSLYETLNNNSIQPNKSTNQTNQAIYKRYIHKTQNQSKIHLDTYINSLNDYPSYSTEILQNKHLLEQSIQYSKQLKLLKEEQLLIEHLNDVKALHPNSDPIIQNHIQIIKKKYSTINQNNIKNQNTTGCFPTIKPSDIPDTLQHFLAAIIYNNSHIQTTLTKIKTSWENHSKTDPNFLKNFTLTSTFSVTSPNIMKTDSIVEYINSKWKITHKSLFLNKTEKNFIRKSKQQLFSVTQNIIKDQLSYYQEYKKTLKILQATQKSLDTLKDSIKEQTISNNETLSDQLTELYRLKMQKLNTQFSQLDHYHRMIYGLKNFRKHILQTNEKQCINNKPLIKTTTSKYLTPSKPLLEIPGDYYTINLATYNTIKDAKRFVSKESISKQTLVYSIDFNNRLIKVIYGAYPNYEQANRAIKNLPKSLKRHKPNIQRVSRHQKLFIKYNNQSTDTLPLF